ITSKFFQYGWRCTTNENDYSNKTLMGNWNEERYDTRKLHSPSHFLPSFSFQYSHCFETTYSSDYNKEKHQRTRRFEREPHWFPGHQPELEPPSFKSTAQSCYTVDYRPPYGTNFFALVQNSEQKQEGYNRCGETMPSE
uniref:Chromosome 11 open reading frame 1 n=1 Tax=Anser cygnoides TaxID=8845 RepID=A0A8B9EA47_ANSCY